MRLSVAIIAAADGVRDFVERRDLVRFHLRHHLRNQPGLQIARELELIAKTNLVDQLHRQQQRDEEEHRRELDERPERRMAHLREERKEAEEEVEPAKDED